MAGSSSSASSVDREEERTVVSVLDGWMYWEATSRASSAVPALGSSTTRSLCSIEDGATDCEASKVSVEGRYDGKMSVQVSPQASVQPWSVRAFVRDLSLIASEAWSAACSTILRGLFVSRAAVSVFDEDPVEALDDLSVVWSWSISWSSNASLFFRFSPAMQVSLRVYDAFSPAEILTIVAACDAVLLATSLCIAPLRPLHTAGTALGGLIHAALSDLLRERLYAKLLDGTYVWYTEFWGCLMCLSVSGHRANCSVSRDRLAGWGSVRMRSKDSLVRQADCRW